MISGCGKGDQPSSKPAAPPRNLMLITIDTLRADRLGVYGYMAARTPVIDGLARGGARFSRAYAAAPITLPSHATLMTGRYPPSHGARHNGMRVDPSVPTIAERLKAAGFATGAFVAAFPLDQRFGLGKGFDLYEDRMPTTAQGRPANVRPASQVVDQALVWLRANRGKRYFLWVHVFEPHAPYGQPGDRRPMTFRYDDEVAEVDRQIGRLLDALSADMPSTVTVIASDHGEAFGEHSEIGHSIFVYDTTLQVPLVIYGPSIDPRVIDQPVGLVDVAPTALKLLGLEPLAGDGIDLSRALLGHQREHDNPESLERDLYAESFAPLLDFGWSPLRSIRADGLKYIAAPKPELFDVKNDAAEATNLFASRGDRARALNERVNQISPATLAPRAAIDPKSLERLQSLGYASGSPSTGSGQAAQDRPDPKDRRDVAARIAQVTSGELTGEALETTLRAILKDDPRNPQAHLRLGYVLAESNRCKEAEPHFRAAIEGNLPTADAHLGLAGCYAAARAFDKAEATLRDGSVREPDNPVVFANQGIMLSEAGQPAKSVPLFQRALAIDPDFHEARFNLAIALAKANRRSEAAAEAQELLKRLPVNAPQRPEVQRLLDAVK
jgi:tetratricopeptide (TPR) repeat protein